MTRVPIRSEREAFIFAVAGAAAVGMGVLVGWLTEAAIGAAVFGFLFVVALIAYLRASDPDRRLALREAARARHPHGATAGTRHVLVVANAALSGGDLRSHLLPVAGERVEVDVLAPVLTSHVHLAVTDIDRELTQAHERLERSLAWMHEMGIAARGEVGSTSPTSAIEDELRDFGADELIVVTHPRERESWQERDELERLRRELDVPIAHIELAEPEPAPRLNR